MELLGFNVVLHNIASALVVHRMDLNVYEKTFRSFIIRNQNTI